jgi:hypothetical protein
MKNNEFGQSTIEFIFTFAFGVSVVLLIFNSAMNYTVGYLVHYATYMASRTYLTVEMNNGTFGDYSSSLNRAQSAAQRTFAKYNLGIFKVPTDSLKINHAGNVSAADYLQVGAYTSFKRDIDALGKVAGQSKVDLVSESFLGKEPTRAVCAARVCKAISNREVCSPSMDITLFDDGC